MEIRHETEGDIFRIRDINVRAFGRNEEARLVDSLRAEGYAKLSLVAEDEGQVVGHIMFSEAVIHTGEKDVATLALGPVGVIPERQGRGIGSALIREGLDRCAEAGDNIVVLLGHPGYYPRFGFSPDLARNLNSVYAGEAFMALELTPGALSGVAGDFRFPPPFEVV